jgi:hypothetical protein
MRGSAREVNMTYGPPELCVWKVAPGTFWFQTTDPEYSRKLDQRQDTRRVEVTGVNHYRRTYEMRGTWRKVKGIVNRYVMPTSDAFSSRISPPARRKSPGVSSQRGGQR